MNEEKQKFIGGIDFDELMSQRIQVYNTIVIDLASARSNEERTFVGNYLYVLEATDVDANLDIRFNQSFRGSIKLVKGRGVRAPFYRFYLTNIAQAAKTITLAIGVESDSFEIFDVGKALEITGSIKTTTAIEAYTVKAENALDSETVYQWVGFYVSRLDIFVWDNPLIIQFWLPLEAFGQEIEIPVGFYSVDIRTNSIQYKNKTAGQTARFQVIGWL